ncbi:TetR family transcriptional regulator [Phenylobacterium sp. NIBR 498073]|uniref:TetR family transcriptional regulator n=1 Tax=Phenylobacterium sp. NIBR 498073 TaxID=3015177 RepID=UPI0022B5D634|nr:TetR family transcriptional regulator [Phenylobacterium sp. NIBR 498073]MBS0491952.1 TetR family transcriptional regulator [Pseudomonadota bacterium]WGU38755.1 TetR family transcriptional regulator [Phenylobacterium sp. NIBR 498073]
MESAETSSAPTAERILEAARLRLAAGGFRDLTLRPLAEASGSTVAALTYHFGSKRALIERLVQAERQADAARHAAFLARFAGLRALAPAALVALLEHYLDEAAGRERVTSLIWCELLLAAVGDPEARDLVAPWIAERRAFWDAVFEGRIGDPQAWARACLGYVTDETAHGLAQQDSPDYRLMRAMTLERLAGRGASLGLSEPAFFEAVVRRLDPALALPGPASQAPYAGRALDIAMAAGEVIVARGAEGVTHRAVGERAQAPASSVAYHFRTRLDLLRAGLTVIYLVAQGRLAPRQDQAEIEAFVARGTVSVALAAARESELRPYAVDLRRLRGENLRRRAAERLGRDLDLCAAQSASVARLGATLLARAEGSPPQSAELVDWMLARAT